MGIIAHLSGEYSRSKALLQEGLKIAQESKDDWFTAYAIYNLGYVDSMLEDYQQGYQQMVIGLDMWRSIGDLHYIALGLNFLVSTLIQLGRYEEAKTSMVESIALCEQAKNRWGIGTAYRHLGLAAMAAGQIHDAKTHFRKSIDIFSGYAEEWHVAQSQVCLGEAEILDGNLSEAHSIYLNTLRMSINVKSIPIAMESLLGLASLEFEYGKPERALEISHIVTRHPYISQEVRDRAIQMKMKSQLLLPDSNIQEICDTASKWTMKEFVKRYKLDGIYLDSPDWGKIDDENGS